MGIVSIPPLKENIFFLSFSCSGRCGIFFFFRIRDMLLLIPFFCLLVRLGAANVGSWRRRKGPPARLAPTQSVTIHFFFLLSIYTRSI